MCRKGWGLISTPPRWLLLTCVLVLVMIAGCGLPTIPFLDAPENPQAQGINDENFILTFQHNSVNDGDDFQGYDLYYKFYTEDQTQLIDSDSNFIEATPRQPGPNRLLSRGFVRAAAVREWDQTQASFAVVSSDRPPHVPTDPTSSSIEYRLDLRSVTEDGPTNPDAEADVILSWTQGGEQRRGFRRRSSEDAFSSDPTELKSFWNRRDYLPPEDDTDYDLAQMGLQDEFESGAPDRIRVVWYVLSYGIDAATLQGYYSEPLRLIPAELVLRDP